MHFCSIPIFLINYRTDYLWLIFAMVLDVISPERYELKAGDIPTEAIAAPRDVEDVRATQERIEQARQRVNDIYTFNHSITAAVIAETEEIFDGMEKVRDEADKKLQEWKRQQAEQIQKEAAQQEQENNNITDTDVESPDTESPGIENTNPHGKPVLKLMSPR